MWAGSALRVPAFRRLWVAGVVSDTGDWLMFIALPLVVLRLTGSALGTSIAFLLELAPPVLLAPFAARVVDRYPPRRLMVVAMLAQAVSLLPLLMVRDTSDLPLLYGVIVAQASFATFFEPAKNALMPTLVGPERAVSANALTGLNNDLGRIIGGPLGGILLLAISLNGVVLVNLMTYLVAAALVVALPQGSAVSDDAPSKKTRSPRSGVLRAFTTPLTRAPLIVAFAASIGQGLFVVLFVFFVTDIIDGTSTDVGVLRGVQAVGAIVAGAFLGIMGGHLRILRLTVLGAAVFAALTAVIWNLSFVTHSVLPYGFLFGAIGAPAVLLAAGLTSLLQNASVESRRGSTFAALGLSQAAGQAIGLLTAGGLLEIIGTLPLLEIQAATYGIAALLALVLLRETTPPRHRAD
ncbi:MFS transporter [Actinoplanes sp. NPDC051859]|uniref:MFS transporter n=1 Tax=Actinoplanes sp. NPDC051859 TaxID=3363909 RepID=UPI0037ADACD9